MNYKITYTKRFIKNLKRLNAAERAQLKKKLEILEMDPLYPSLRTKRIQGTVDLFEFSVNMDVRVIWQYDGDTIILLLDIGHHDILNQFEKPVNTIKRPLHGSHAAAFPFDGEYSAAVYWMPVTG